MEPFTEQEKADNQKFYQQQYSEKNRESIRQSARLRATVRKKLVDDIKLEAGCMDCGVKDYIPEVYDFDHRPGEEKVGNIASMKVGNMEKLLAEIAKCDVVCANCHRVRTTDRPWNANHGKSRASVRDAELQRMRDAGLGG